MQRMQCVPGLGIWLSTRACLAHGFHSQEEGRGKPLGVLLMKQSLPTHPGWAEMAQQFPDEEFRPNLATWTSVPP